MRLVLLTCGALIANVAPAAAAPASADQLFQEGRALLAERHFAEACERFEASMRLDPEAAGVLLNLGLCNEELGRLATALRWFHTAALAAKVPTLAIAFALPPPADTTVTVDGVVVPSTELRRLEVDPGRHVVEARAAGQPTIRRTIQIVAGESKPIPLGFAVERRRDVPRVAYYLVGGGATVVAAATAIAVLGMRGTDSGSRSETQRWNSFADYGLTSMYAGGLACLGVGIALYLRAPLVPVVELDRVSLAITGRF
ncbi:MAG: hypothetical protein NT062_12695 [Proteobacteria bacterium]|nr:hypothetical protein [Pseudomonadota bacterium]